MIKNQPVPNTTTTHSSTASAIAADLSGQPRFHGRLHAWVISGAAHERRDEAATAIFGCWSHDRSELDLRGMVLTSLPECLIELSALRRLDMDRNLLNALQVIPQLPPACLIYVEDICFSVDDISDDGKQGNAKTALRLLDAAPCRAGKKTGKLPCSGGRTTIVSLDLPQQLLDALSKNLYRQSEPLQDAQAVPEKSQPDRKEANMSSPEARHHGVKKRTVRRPLSAMLKAATAMPHILSQTFSISRKPETMAAAQLHAFDQPLSPAAVLPASASVRTAAEPQIDPGITILMLLDAATRIGITERADIGTRQLSKKDCLLIALEWAMESRPGMIPMISRRIIDELPPDISRFVVLGISYDRSDLRDWSLGNNVPAPAAVADEVQILDAIIHQNNRQNTHDPAVVAYIARQLGAMQERIENHIPADRVRAVIQAYLPSQLTPAGRLAHRGLTMALALGESTAEFEQNPMEALRVVCSYIESARDDAMKEALRNALISRLVEIGRFRPCPDGMLERIVDVPAGIDLSINIPVPQFAIDDEVAHMAARINEDFESEYGYHADQVREQAEKAHIAADPESVISELKRDMLIHKARTILVEQRGLSRDMVQKSIDKVLPEKTIF